MWNLDFKKGMKVERGFLERGRGRGEERLESVLVEGR
jgi:hypothetical protein